MQIITEIGALSGMLLAEGVDASYVFAETQVEGMATLVTHLDAGRTLAIVDIERATWRPRRWRFDCGGRRSMFVLRGTLEFDGITFPSEFQSGAEETLVLNLAEDAGADPERYCLRTGRPADCTFAPTVGSALEVRKGPDHRVYVRPRIDGKDVGWFLFDTGAVGNFVGPGAFADLGMAPFGEGLLGGIGPDTLPLRFARARSLSLGPLTVAGPLLEVGEVSIDHPDGECRGVIGYPVLARCVVELDTEGGSVRLFDPDTLRAARGHVVPARP